ncbi:MAG: DUF520 family protein, partial [Syntrophaceae bacterium]|nr:DUF520 family protein [Syntrophaceae bacterium]
MRHRRDAEEINGRRQDKTVGRLDFPVRERDLLFFGRQKLAKRGVPLKALAWTDPRPAAGSTVRQTVELQNGIPIEKARLVVSLIKGTKLKVQAQIMGDQLRVR